MAAINSSTADDKSTAFSRCGTLASIAGISVSSDTLRCASVIPAARLLRVDARSFPEECEQRLHKWQRIHAINASIAAVNSSSASINSSAASINGCRPAASPKAPVTTEEVPVVVPGPWLGPDSA
eukprot:3834388-Rhodomonas_salina.5